ncbi:MAG TPA: PorP/SprF family type IX secretion system membrane protein [Salinivirgaceae bacterium]|nr:PorP/SprF family type IX secretion system membrane protein [Salinivirgaceae bacterium]
MRRKLLIGIFSVLWVTALSGQQLPQSSFFVYDQMTINPGYAGSQEGICVNILARNQWMGFEGAPQTQKFDLHLPFKLFGLEHGAGIALYNDKVGFNNDISSSLSYSFIRSISIGRVGVGLGLSFFSQTLKAKWDFPTYDFGTQTGSATDPFIPNESAKGKIAFDLNLGTFYKGPNVLMGISINNLLQTPLQTKSETSGVNAYSFLARHLNVIGSYNYQLSNPQFELQPAIGIMTTGRNTQLSINSTLKYRSKIWGGIGYRTSDAIITFIGAEFIEGLNFGLSYDVTTSKIAKFDDGSVEIFLRYVFKLMIEKEHTNYKSIRFL